MTISEEKLKQIGFLELCPGVWEYVFPLFFNSNNITFTYVFENGKDEVQIIHKSIFSRDSSKPPFKHHTGGKIEVFSVDSLIEILRSAHKAITGKFPDYLA